MGKCAQCGERTRFWRRVVGPGGLEFCGKACFNAYQTGQVKKQEREAKEKERQQRRELELLHWTASHPSDPEGYIQQGHFLLTMAGVDKDLEDVHMLEGLKEERLEKKLFGVSPRARARRERVRRLLEGKMEEACEAYQKAIALRAALSPFRTACIALEYAKLLWVLDDDQHRHYAREAEKDLRQHLRKDPDHAEALEKLRLATMMFDGPNSKRLSSIEARIQEARIRQQLGVAAPFGTRPPGEPAYPYPPNWSEVSQNIRKRDRYRCTQCGASDVELHVHHIVPLSQGGSNDPDNLITLCDYCHKEIHPRMG
ncbi:MAG: HNH endonuclease [Chloroflexi bacterium]|nr:HNH endonuclease [Chloroflexota bacterium]